jgi:hypothetical protein
MADQEDERRTLQVKEEEDPRHPKRSMADLLYQRCLTIYEIVFGAENIHVANALESYAHLLRETKRKTRAAELEARAAMIRARYAQDSVGGEV